MSRLDVVSIIPFATQVTFNPTALLTLRILLFYCLQVSSTRNSDRLFIQPECPTHTRTASSVATRRESRIDPRQAVSRLNLSGPYTTIT